MALRRRQRLYAFVLSVLGHAGIVAALTFSIPLSSRQAPSAGGVVVPIEAVMINESAIEAEMARLEAAEEAERIRREAEAEQLQRQREDEQRELARIQAEREEAERVAEVERVERERQRADEERLRLQRLEEQRLEEQRLEAERLVEQERIEREKRAEAERQRLEAERLEAERAAEAERQRQAAEEAARLAAVEAEFQRAIEAERRAREAENSGLRAQWAAAISDRVQRYWNQPPNAGVGLECIVIVTQLPNGEVTDVTVESCNRDDPNIIRSVENAVLNASPLPGPPRGVPFERVVRITFRPIQ